MKQQRKTIAAFVLICLLVASVLSPAVCAEGAPQSPAVMTIGVPDEGVHKGDTVSLTVDLVQNPGLIGLDFSLVYDPDVLTLTAVEKSGMFQSGSLTFSKELSCLPYAILWEDSTGRSNHTETGTILTLTFTVSETAPDVTPVRLICDPYSAYNWDLQPVPLQMTGTELTARVHRPGDTDGDGEFDLADVASLVRYLAGGWDVTVDVRNADVDGDGKLTLKDAVRARRYLAGWDVTLY